jgi:hypothetical protein
MLLEDDIKQKTCFACEHLKPGDEPDTVTCELLPQFIIPDCPVFEYYKSPAS